MAEEAGAKIIQGFARDISVRLDEAAIIARTADELGKQGLTEHAFRSLMDIENLIHEASILLDAAAIVRRCETSGDSTMS